MKNFLKTVALSIPALRDAYDENLLLKQAIKEEKEKEEVLKEDIKRIKEENSELEKQKEYFQKEADWAYNGCGVREEEIKWLKIDKEKLEEEKRNLQNEITYVYSGHKGLEEEINFLKFRVDEVSRLHDEVVERQWNNDESRKKYTCLYPFERIEILSRGEVYTCCSGYLKHNYYIGNIFEQEFDEIWNSEKAKKLRYSVSKGNFEYCNRFCKWLYVRGGGAFDDVMQPKNTTQLNPIKYRYNVDYKNYKDCVIKNNPRYITLTCDDTCNLKCPSCRSGLKIINNEEEDRIFEVLVKVIRPLLYDCELLGALSSGEFFASNAIMRFYNTLTKKEFPNLKLYILTNAQLLKAKWDYVKGMHEFPIRLGVSIDSCEKDTYEKLRLGAKWSILLENLNYISRLRQFGNIEFLCFHFVVQAENYLQMEDFIEFSKEYKADAIEFQLLGNWGTVSYEDYIRKNVFHESNIKRKEALSILNNILNNENGIDIIQNIT